MKIPNKNMLKKLLSLVLIVLLGLMTVNKSIFTHSHKLGNGIIITHSHPYNTAKDTTPFKEHHHSQSQLLFYASIDIVFVAIFFVLGLKLIINTRNIKLYRKILHHLFCKTTNSGRSPPLFS